MVISELKSISRLTIFRELNPDIPPFIHNSGRTFTVKRMEVKDLTTEAVVLL